MRKHSHVRSLRSPSISCSLSQPRFLDRILFTHIVMERLKTHLKDQGIGIADLPKAIVFHEVLGAGMALAFWTCLQACYRVQPSSNLLRPLARRASRNALARKSFSSAVQSASTTMHRLPVLQRLGDPGRLTASLAESICVRAGLKPATFPFKIWASYQFVKVTKRHQQRLSNPA